MTKYSSWVRFSPDDPPLDRRVQQRQMELPAEVKSPGHEIFIDWGLPIPDRYNENYLYLMLQDPYRGFCYWELGDDTLQRYFPKNNPPERQNHLELTLHNLTDMATMPILPGLANSWWLHLNPDRMYRATLDVRFPDGHTEMIASSNEVHTPRDSVSWMVEPYDLLQEENMVYLQLLTLSGAEPIDHDFLEILRQCQVYDRVFVVPEFLLRYLPDWLRSVIRKLNFRLPWSIFLDFVLRRYFPEFLHRLILETPGIKAADFENFLHQAIRPGVSSLAFYSGRPDGDAWPLGQPQDGRT